MNIHYSSYEKELNWIPISSRLPDPNKRVKIAYIHFSDWNLELLMWETTGWYKKGNTWSITIGKDQNKEYFKKYGLKPTHWKLN